MDLTTAKVLSALVLFILSSIFGLVIPWSLWRTRAHGYRKVCGRHRNERENHNLLLSDADCEMPQERRQEAGGGGGTGSSSAIANSRCAPVKRLFKKLLLYNLVSAINCFCGGLFLGIFLIELLPEAHEDVRGVLDGAGVVTSFPVAELLIGAGLLLVMFVENGATALCGAHQHHQNHHHQHHIVTASTTENELGVARTSDERHPVAFDDDSDGDEPAPKTPEVARMLVLIAMLSVHSVFEGVALGLQGAIAPLMQLLMAVSVHKSVLGFGLGVRLFETFGDVQRVATAVACLVIFCAASPLGCVIGIFVTGGGSRGPVVAPTVAANSTAAMPPLEGVPAREVLGALLQCLATGTFLYVTFIEVLPDEFSHAAKDHDDGGGESRIHEHNLVPASRHFAADNSPRRRRKKRPIRKLVKLALLLVGYAVICGLQFVQ